MVYMNMNPIKTVNGAPISKCPSSYVWKLEDISSSDAGRTEDVKMNKMRIGQIIGIDLSWTYLTLEEAAEILAAFNNEYITVEYLDAMSGSYLTAEFYVDSRSAPLYNAELEKWESLSFSITKRTGV